jgi:rare lipoprotein A
MKFFISIFFILLFGCQSPTPVYKNDGKYYEDDGPHKEITVDLDSVENAIPINEPLNKNANKPYKALDNEYTPLTQIQPFYEEGYASWYGKKYHGRKTSIGEVYDMYKMSGAHPTLPLPSYVKVKNLINNKEVIVRLNDRGPFLRGRIIDLSYVAAHKLEIIDKGSEKVSVELIDPNNNQKTSSSNGKFIQAGAFKLFNNANLMKDKISNLLSSEGYPLKIVNEAGLYRVLIGPLTDDEKLNELMEQINKEYKITVIVKEHE